MAEIKYYNNRQRDKMNVTIPTSRTGKIKFAWPKMPFLAVSFLVIWLFSWLIYGDVFYICEQWSYFAFDKELMHEVLCVKTGALQIVGRFFLLFFKYPWLGGLIYSLILTSIVYFLIYIFNLNGFLRLLSLIPVCAWFVYIVSIGLSLFYQYDQSFAFYGPVICLLALILISFAVRIISKRKFPAVASDCKTDGTMPNVLNLCIPIVFFVLLSVYCSIEKQDVLYTTRMMRLCQNQDWNEMIDLGLKAKNPSKAVAAYYAIGLRMNDQLNERLFDIYHQYPQTRLINRTGVEESGYLLYESEIDFHFGLINPAYHYCMEHTVMSGKSVYCLKYMFLTSLLRNEKELADKYLELISFVPFERSFVKKYRPMLFDNSLVNSDYLLSTVYSMIPASDAYEEEFPIPLYIWYHKYLNNFYSRRTFENSMAVALYTKDLDDFTKLARIMPDEPTVPAAFEDALVVEAMRKNDMKFLQQIPEYAVSSTKQMLNEAASLRGKSTKEKGIALKDKYTGKYTFYYFYQNLKDEESYRVNNTINSINSQVN